MQIEGLEALLSDTRNPCALHVDRDGQPSAIKLHRTTYTEVQQCTDPGCHILGWCHCQYPVRDSVLEFYKMLLGELGKILMVSLCVIFSQLHVNFRIEVSF